MNINVHKFPVNFHEYFVLVFSIRTEVFVNVSHELVSTGACRLTNLKTHQLKNLLYSIASDEIRFSLKSLATSFLSPGSGRKMMRWPVTMAEGEKSLAAIASCE